MEYKKELDLWKLMAAGLMFAWIATMVGLLGVISEDRSEYWKGKCEVLERNEYPVAIDMEEK